MSGFSSFWQVFFSLFDKMRLGIESLRKIYKYEYEIYNINRVARGTIIALILFIPNQFDPLFLQHHTYRIGP